AINAELTRRGYESLNLEAHNTTAIQEHVAMIAQRSGDLTPVDGALGNYMNDIKDGHLKYGPNASSALTYQGETELTLETLEKRKGRSTVSRQFISDLTNSPDLKQQERD